MNLNVKRMFMFVAAAVMAASLVASRGVCGSHDGLEMKHPPELTADSAALVWDPAVLRGKLDNGISYYIRANRKPEKRVELRLVVKAGSILEDADANGIAHFIEHMGFNGTTHFKPGELVKYFESVGADWGPDTNAYTTMDHTQYMLTLPTDTPEPLDKGLLTMADYAGGMLFLEEEVAKERGIVLEELRLGRDAQTRIFEKALGIILAGSLYPERLTIGKKELIEKFTAKKCVDYYRKWYRPDRMGVVVVGDIDPAGVEKKIKELFSVIPAPADSAELPVFGAPQHKDVRAGIITDPEMPVSTSMIVYTRPPSRNKTAGDFRADLTRSFAYGIYNDRLKELTLKDNPPFKDAGAGDYWPMIGMNIVAIYSMVEMKKEKKALTALVTEAERIRRHGVLPEELEEQKKRTGEALRAAVEEKDKMESSGFARELSSTFTFNNIFMDVAENKRLFDLMRDSITTGDVQAELERLFSPENMSALLILPEFEKSMYKPEDIKKTIEDARASDIKPYTREAVSKSVDYTKLQAGKVVDRKEFKDIGVTRVQFDNGLRVFLKPTDFQKDEIAFTGFTPGGVLYEDYSNRGLSRVALASWLQGGTKDLTSVQIDRLMSGKTINIGGGGRENYSLSGGTVNKDFEETLQWMRDYLTEPGYREEGVAKAKTVLIDELKQQSADQDGVLRMNLQEMLCPGAPIAYTPTEEDINRVTSAQIRELHEKNVAPSNMELTFAGNLDVDRAIELIAKYLGSIPPKQAAPIPAASRSCKLPEGYTRRTVYKGMENRTGIAIVFPGPTIDAPDRAAVEVMTKVADMRMNDILREKMSGTYYAYLYAANNSYIKGRDILVAGLATAPDRVDEMISEALKIFKEIAEKGPTDEEMKSSKEIFSKDQEENLKKNEYWIGAINGKDAAGLPIDLDMKMKADRLKVTPEQVKAAAEKYLLGRNRVEIVALPDKVAEPQKDDKKEGK